MRNERITRLHLGTAALLLIGLSGCALFRPKVLVLPRDRAVAAMPAGKACTPASDGYFVPKARMQDILDRLSERDVFK